MNYNRIGRPQNDSTWQGQLMWHSERARGIGGSEIAVLTGDSPWMTPFQLWEYKTSKKDSKDISSLSHIQRGILGEKIARAKLTDKYIPYTWVIENTPYRCSDDGYNKELNQMIEIKCMSARVHEEFKDNVEKAKSYSAKIKAIPIYYLHQCIWNLFVSGASTCRFISFNPETEDMCEVLVKPDQKKAKQYIKKVDKFWTHVVSGLPPALSDRDQEIIQDDTFSKLECDWVELKDEIDTLSERIKQIEISLKGYTNKHPRIKGGLVQITRTLRIGSVDYKRAFSEVGISLDDYRGEPTELIRISRVKCDDA